MFGFCDYQICLKFFYVFRLVTIFLPNLKWTKSVRLFLLCLQFVLATAPRLCVCLEGPKSVSVLTNVPYLSGGSKSVLSVSVRRIPICFCAHQCTTSGFVYLEGPKSVTVLTNAPRLFVSAWRVPTYFVLTNAPRLLSLPGRSKSVFVLANAPRLCVSV